VEWGRVRTMTSAYQRLVEALGELDLNLAAAVDGAARDRSTTGEPLVGEPGAGEPGADGSGAGEPGAGEPGAGEPDASDGSARVAGRCPGILVEELSGLLQTWQQNLRSPTGPDCQRCPVCQLVALVRQPRPEVLDHLISAAGELVAAVRLAVRQPETAPSGHRSGASVERIDVTD
jgi:hypothetical protein